MGTSRSWSNWRFLAFFLGSLLLFSAVFRLLEKVVPSDGSASTAPGPGVEAETLRPRLSRQSEKIILVDTGLFGQSRWRFGAEETVDQVDAIFQCFEDGIERELGGDNAIALSAKEEERWSQRQEMRARMQQIQRRCLQQVLDLPAVEEVPPAPPLRARPS